MSSHSIEINWELGNNQLSSSEYITDHIIKFNEKTLIKGGSSPDYGGDAININPEQSLAAAVSSCYMMTFLALAAKMRWPIIKYSDKAIAYLDKNSKGKIFVNKIELNPIINFKKNFKVSEEEILKMRERSHRYCFIANSLSDEVRVVIN